MTLPKTPSFRLDGKTALVTGASSGIGLACATALGEAGAHVILAARGVSRLEETLSAFKDAGFSAEALALDVGDIDQCREVLDARPEAIDVLVNSAGLARHSPATETTAADFDAVMDVNLRGAYFLSQTVAKRLIAEQKPGSIIMISSQMAKVGGIDRAVYCASKHAVDGFVKAMAIEWGPHQIRINSINPTFIRTPLTESTFDQPDKVDWIKQKIKLGRVGEVEDMMGPTQFLASDASALVTGTSLLVDGGWTAG